MHLSHPDDLGHLTYCTNIHAGETWADVFERLKLYLPEVKAEISPDAPFGVGLRLANAASETLAEPGMMEAFKSFLADGGYYVFTLNGFPYGTFHGSRVKEGAYLPDWSEDTRLSYTNRLADQLAELQPDGMDGSLSTVPGTFKPWAEGRVEAITNNLIAHVAHLVALRERTGKTVNLAIEPEPYCFLETIEETVDYFQNHLFSDAALATLTKQTGQSRGDAADSLRRHIGLCYDVCHAAVEFEDPRESVAALRRAGIGIGKVQLSSALRVTEIGPSSREQLEPFSEPVYLHQTVQSKDGAVTRFVDLPEALAQIDEAHGSEWRIHFHVPIFLEHMRDFSTTQSFLREILAMHRENPISKHLEVETYTWDVLPEQYRGLPVGKAIAREMNWVKGQLGA
jgi:sugar phosphate isomerase/epimerase